MGYELIASTVIAWILAQIIKSAIKLAKDFQRLLRHRGHAEQPFRCDLGYGN